MAGGDPAKVNFLYPVRLGNEPLPGSNAWAIAPDCNHQRSPGVAGDPSCSRKPSDTPIGSRPRNASGIFQRATNAR